MRDKLTLEQRQAISIKVAHLYQGFGRCGRCARPWPICESHTTPYKEGYGMFPLCQDCWEELTPQERLKYYYQLCLEWSSFGANEGDDFVWKEIETAVLKGL